MLHKNENQESKDNEDKQFSKLKYKSLVFSKTNPFYSFIFNSDCTVLFAGEQDGKIRRFRFNSIKNLFYTLSIHQNCISNYKVENVIKGSENRRILIRTKDGKQYAIKVLSQGKYHQCHHEIFTIIQLIYHPSIIREVFTLFLNRKCIKAYDDLNNHNLTFKHHDIKPENLKQLKETNKNYKF